MAFSTIYVENAVADHDRTAAILSRNPAACVVRCKAYGQVFNRKAQNFRLQKRRPALILARKPGRWLHAIPGRYGIGAMHSYYFSHMLNCIFDCRYCFLQGMHRSAHYLLFVNFEDFSAAIPEKARGLDGSPAHFFSGYDCDSLALDPLTGFTQHFLPLFRELPGALLELRTKSTQIRALLDMEPLANCIVAFSFTPASIARALEYKVPDIGRRLRALSRLQGAGWRLGLRFDPLIYSEDYRRQYRDLFGRLFDQVDPERLHSVSLGGFRLPAAYFERMLRLYPRETLFASPLQENGGTVEYPARRKAELLDFCRDALLQRIPPEKLFICDPI